MAPRLPDPTQLASVLPAGGRTLVLACSGESLLLAEAVMRAGHDLGAMIFTGIFVPGLNSRTYLANPLCRVETFFLTPELKAAVARRTTSSALCLFMASTLEQRGGPARRACGRHLQKRPGAIPASFYPSLRGALATKQSILSLRDGYWIASLRSQ